ncbi:MAG: hypothetical protein ACYS47_02805 [Planctomycetota bacterium]|jgi:hypothetical protein
MKTIPILAALLIALPAGSALAQKGRTLNLPWTNDAEDAVAKAKAAKKPIAVCFIQKTCRLSMWMVKGLHDDGRIYELTDRFVWLCVDPSRRSDFKWFIGICGDAVEGTPTIFFLNEKGQYADPKLAGIEPVCGADPCRIVASLRTVLGRFKQDLDAKAKKDLQEKVKNAGESAEAEPARALALYREAIRTGEGWASVEETVGSAREGLEKLLQKGMEKVREILGKRMEPDEAKKALETVKASYPDSPVAHWCDKELARRKKNKK